MKLQYEIIGLAAALVAVVAFCALLLLVWP